MLTEMAGELRQVLEQVPEPSTKEEKTEFQGAVGVLCDLELEAGSSPYVTAELSFHSFGNCQLPSCSWLLVMNVLKDPHGLWHFPLIAILLPSLPGCTWRG